MLQFFAILLTLFFYHPSRVSAFVFQNPAAAQFWVNGHILPGISSMVGDVGESWAGKIPISKTDSRALFFWLWPPVEGVGTDSLTIWLQGGPGASSMKGLLQEVGPFLLPVNSNGQDEVRRNGHPFTKVSWLLVVDQPAGVGLSDGPHKARNEHDLSQEFVSWLLNLMELFPELRRMKISIVAESYGSQYAFHISDYIFKHTDLRLQRLGIISGILTSRLIQQEAPLYEFVERRQQVLGLNQTTMNEIKAAAAADGLTTFVKDRLHYPPRGPIRLPRAFDTSHSYVEALNTAVIQEGKGCLNIYNVAEGCPLPWYDPLGTPPGNASLAKTTASNFINNTPGFRAAIHADGSTWRMYQSSSPFVGGKDRSLYPMETSLFQRVVDKMQKVVISAGMDDMILCSLGTQVAIQSATWGGKQGFQSGEKSKLIARRGVDFGTWHTERGLTLALVRGAGHEIPSWEPEVALRLHKFLWDQVTDLSSDP